MGKNSQTIWCDFAPRAICISICVFFFGINTSCWNGDKKGEKLLIEKRYEPQIYGLREVANSFQKYISNGQSWNEWLDEHSGLYVSNDIVRAEVQGLSSETMLLVKRTDKSRLSIIGRTIPAVGHSSCSRGHIVIDGKTYPVVEYLENVAGSPHGQRTLISLTVTVNGVVTDSGSRLTIWNRFRLMGKKSKGVTH